MRDWRAARGGRGGLTETERRKDNARSYAGVYKRRGRIVPEPCERCGATDAEMHHEDYERPLDVRWLCPPCHRAEHRVIA